MALSTALDLAIAGHTIEQTQALVARLDLFDESIVLTTFKKGRAQMCHEVDPTDLAGVLAGVPLVTGHLPPNCLFYERQAGVEAMAILLPAQERTLTARIGDEVKRYQIPCPNLVWYGKGSKYHVWAIFPFETWPAADAALFLPPFPNVHDDGWVCTGNVPFPICNASSIRAAADLFFESEFNSHLAGSRSHQRPENVLTAWGERASTKKPWPVSDLYPTDRTLAELREGRYV